MHLLSLQYPVNSRNGNAMNTETKYPVSLSNLPNTITLMRIILIPFFAAFLIYHYYHCALYIFIIAGLSDALDGFLARKLKLQSDLGRLLDPIADKLLVVSSLVLFTYSGWIPVWFTIAVLSRDLFMFTGWIVMFLLYSTKTVQPSIIGKSASALQMCLIAYVLIDRTVPAPLPGKAILIWVTAALTIVSGLHYIYRGMRHVNG